MAQSKLATSPLGPLALCRVATLCWVSTPVSLLYLTFLGQLATLRRVSTPLSAFFGTK